MQLAEEVKPLSSSVPLITAAVKPAIKPLGCLVLRVHQPVGTSEASRSSVSGVSVARVRCNGTKGATWNSKRGKQVSFVCSDHPVRADSLLLPSGSTQG